MNTISYNLKRVLRTSSIGRSYFYLAMRYFAKRNQMEATINKYLGDNLSDAQRKKVGEKMRYAMIKYRWAFDEFFMFHFEDISEEKRRSYVPEYDKNIFCDLINDARTADIFLDKWQTYLHYSEFFKRDVCNIRSVSDIEGEKCVSFLRLHDRFMLKPVYGALGKGIQILDKKDGDLKTTLQETMKSGVKALILEECIIQDPRMAELHPSSVNTLRIRTVNVNGTVKFIYPSIRMGRANSIIDNAGAGGIMGNIDLATGKVYEACDKSGVRYTVHPDSNVQLIGFMIPKWNEALELAKLMALKNPKVRYVGWDLALSKDKGWVMIEGNDKGQWGFQYVMQKGFRDEMNMILRELGKKTI